MIPERGNDMGRFPIKRYRSGVQMIIMAVRNEYRMRAWHSVNVKGKGGKIFEIPEAKKDWVNEYVMIQVLDQNGCVFEKGNRDTLVLSYWVPVNSYGTNPLLAVELPVLVPVEKLPPKNLPNAAIVVGEKWINKAVVTMVKLLAT
jgi:hypothetical protein